MGEMPSQDSPVEGSARPMELPFAVPEEPGFPLLLFESLEEPALPVSLEGLVVDK